MILKRFYDEGLAQASYLVGAETTGEALVVDPLRDIDPYLAAASDEGLRVTHVTETHIHADFLSGARDLVRHTGARLLLSAEGDADWQYRFGPTDRAELLRDGDSFMVGEVRVDVRHTPGHTPEHLIFLLTDTAVADRPLGVFTGDFIFVGDVGRPDLLERAARMAGTMETSARSLFRSIRLMREYPEYLQLWPGHGAGSACGKALGSLPSTTLGYERLFNWAFQTADEEDFVRVVLSGQPEAPRYFGRMKLLNRDGPPPSRAVAIPHLAEGVVDRIAGADMTVIDARTPEDFDEGFIPGTINIPAGRSFVTWAGALLPADRDLMLIAEGEQQAQRLSRELFLIGMDRVIAWTGPEVFERWRGAGKPLGRGNTIACEAISSLGNAQIVDVRGESEWSTGHIAGARHLFLGELIDRIDELPRDRPIVVSCQGGTRSSIAASLLRAHGFANVINYAGGFADWQRSGMPVETPGIAASSR
jgi:hydroxyacylglutathione hydrolase